MITDAPGAESWPITATNFILMRKQPRDAADAKAALGYVPLPPELVRQIEAYWAGQPA